MTGQTREPGPPRSPRLPSKQAHGRAIVPAQAAPALAQLQARLQSWLQQLRVFVARLMGKKPAPPPPTPVRRRPSAPQPPAMQPEEKAWFDGLGADEQATYLALPQAQRKLVRADAEGRRRLSSGSRSREGSGETLAQLTTRLVDELIATFHYVPPKPPASSLRDEAVQMVANLLRANNGNVAATRTRTMRSLLERPEFTVGLMQKVEQELAALPPPTRRGAPTYPEAFNGLRASLLLHVEKLIYPDLSGEELVRELVDAVVESVDQQPRSRRANRVSRKIAFEGRHIRG